jgi:hypothetical protein
MLLARENKIGETLHVGGVAITVIESDMCSKCIFGHNKGVCKINEFKIGPCSARERGDHKNIIFRKGEKK